MSNINLLGLGPDQVPTNADLGTMAFQDSDYVQTGNLIAATVDITTEARINRFSTANARITGGSITGVNGAITTLVATNFSSANAEITSSATTVGVSTAGAVSRVANVYASLGNFTDLSTANVQLTGTASSWMRGVAIESANIVMSGGTVGTTAAGALSRVANVYANLGNFTDLSVANAVITSGSATTLVVTNFSSGNATLTGGFVTSSINTANLFASGGAIGITAAGALSRVSNVYANLGNFTDLSTANAVITGGSATTLVATNFSAGNVQLTGTGSSWMRSVPIESANIVMSGGTVGTTAAGALSRVANVYASLGDFTNLASANVRLQDSADLTKIFAPNITQTPASRISNYAMPTVSSTGNGSSLVGTYWRYAANVSYAAQTSTVLFDLLGPTNGTAVTIEAGAMGTQGALRCRLYGNILNTVTATNTSNVMVCFGAANLVLGLTEQLAANAAARPFMLDFTINNLNNASAQTVYGTYYLGAPGSFNSVGSTTQGTLTRVYPFGFTTAINTGANVALRVMAAQNGTTAGMTTTVNYASIQLLHH